MDDDTELARQLRDEAGRVERAIARSGGFNGTEVVDPLRAFELANSAKYAAGAMRRIAQRLETSDG